MSESPTFFATPAKLKAWFKANAGTKNEVWVGFYKKGTGTPSITWPESVDEALCVGWIDGLRKRIDDDAYKIRFTPRKRTSTWSAVNMARVPELEKEGRMTEAGRAAFALRSEARSRVYSHERTEDPALEATELAKFKRKTKAWAYFEAQAPWYKRAALHWVVSAKRTETRLKRFEALVECSSKGAPVKHLDRNG